MIGPTISHYENLQKVGEGGMGVVYRADDTKLMRTAALKFLPPELSRDPEARERFIHEAQAAAGLDHPNICAIHEIGETDDGQAFIAMAHYEGEALKERIARGPLEVEEAFDIAVQVAQGLSRAHEAGVVHRGIKPANIMTTDRGEVKILDFGVAKLAGRTQVTRTGTTVGTAAYMSPEQARGEPADHRTDIWSLGVILYEMLAGQPPFAGEYEQAVLYAIINEESQSLGNIRRGVPEDVEQIVAKAMAKARDERYQNVEDLLEDLRSCARMEVPVFATMRRKVRSFRRRVAPVALALGLIAITTVGAYLWQSRSRVAGPVSIALLPLESFTPDAGQDWFTDGMTDALITDLAKISGLRVISLSSVMRYKGTGKGPREIGEELGVTYLIEGSVVKMGDRVKVSARLIDAPADRYLWAQDYERGFKDILALQGEVARAIAGQVEVKLTPREETRLAASRQVDAEAYELYLKGRHHASRGTRDDTRKAVAYYNRALEQDPDFGPAYTGLVESYLLQGISGLSPEEVSTRFLEYAQKAIELDEALGSDHHQLAMIKLFGEWDWSGAEEELKRAMELTPNSSAAYDSYCQFLWAMGRTEESVAAGERAVEFDPLSHFANCDLAWAYYYDHRHDEATEQVQKTTELFGPACPYHSELGIRLTIEQTAIGEGEYEGLIAELERRIVAMPENRVRTVALLVYVYAKSGQHEQALEIVRTLREQATEEFVDPSHLASVHAALGDKDGALRLLEQAYQRRSFVLLNTIKIDPLYDPLREDPRFQDVLRRMGLDTGFSDR